MDGKAIRLSRILEKNKMLNVPLDHGITNGPVAHLTQFQKLVSDIVDAGATSIIVHKGMVRLLPSLKRTGLIVHLSASTDLVNEVHKNIVCGVEEALKYGADAVSVHVNIGNEYESHMIRDLSYISSKCNDYGLPLVAMMYIRNNDNININACDKLHHAVRVATELGADIVKISAPNTVDELRRIVNYSSIPIIVAGGEKCSCIIDLIKKTEQLMKTGITGVSFGRNVFQSNAPNETVMALRKIVIGE